MHRIGIDVFSGYGLTEGTGGCIVNPIHSIRHESIGIPFIEGLEAKIIDGELCLKGPTIMLGYYKDKAATEEAIVDGSRTVEKLKELGFEWSVPKPVSLYL